MAEPHPFKWRHSQAEIILLCVRWYLRYALSYRDLEEIMLERGLPVDHTTIYRWVQCYAPELEKRCRPHLKAYNDPWKVDETYIKIKKTWTYLYRAVDSTGNTLEFLLSPTRDAEAATRFKVDQFVKTGEEAVLRATLLLFLSLYCLFYNFIIVLSVEYTSAGVR